MIKNLIPFALAFCFTHLYAQNQFSLGQVTGADLQMTTYAPDTTAKAVVLNEFGNAFIGGEHNNRLYFEYYQKVKILKPEGLDEGNIEIVLHKDERLGEKLLEINAASYELKDGAMSTTLLPNNKIFTERNEKFELKKIAIPNTKVGGVIEVTYKIESPYLFNFWPWSFQSDIPKVRSEYWAKIPGIYVYNIGLRGFLQLSKNDQSIVSKCIEGGSGLYAGYSADCIQYKFAMKNIPAFIEEDYMTASENFISAIRFELSEYKSFDGGSNKFTKEWRDAVDELKKDERFGLQLKRCKDIEGLAKITTAGISDPLEKAKKVYRMVQQYYAWNRKTYFLCDDGVKKAFDNKRGNVADINLSLVAALRSVGLDADPLLCSTRDNGTVTELYPVLSDFNYVMGHLKIGNETYLLDATNAWLPFGVVPFKCLNGKGRVFEDKDSYWVNITPSDKKKEICYIDIALGKDGVFRGKVVNTYSGYSAIDKRIEIESHTNRDEYVAEINKHGKNLTINDFTLEGLDNLDVPVRESFDVEIEAFDNINSNVIIFNPFLVDRMERNPFRASERLYPVDFGRQIESTFVISITLPEGFDVDELPKPVGLSLPQGGGRFLFDSNQLGNKITLNYLLRIDKTTFSSDEYFTLKELFNRIIDIQNFNFVCKRKG